MKNESRNTEYTICTFTDLNQIHQILARLESKIKSKSVFSIRKWRESKSTKSILMTGDIR